MSEQKPLEEQLSNLEARLEIFADWLRRPDWTTLIALLGALFVLLSAVTSSWWYLSNRIDDRYERLDDKITELRQEIKEDIERLRVDFRSSNTVIWRDHESLYERLDQLLSERTEQEERAEQERAEQERAEQE